MICLFGVILDWFEKELVLFNWELYLVIGLLCIGVLVLGGVCNNLGGVLVCCGFVYIELVLYVCVNDDG